MKSCNREDWLEIPMVVLDFVWLALFIIEIIWGLNSLLEAFSIIIWILFILDFLFKLVITAHKFSYIKSNWLIAISLVLPALRTFRIIRKVRVLQRVRAVRSVQWL
jgi:voltage-gated potassium channel